MIRCQKFTLLILNINENVKHDIMGSFDDERYKKLRIVLELPVLHSTREKSSRIEVFYKETVLNNFTLGLSLFSQKLPDCRSTTLLRKYSSPVLSKCFYESFQNNPP